MVIQNESNWMDDDDSKRTEPSFSPVDGMNKVSNSVFIEEGSGDSLSAADDQSASVPNGGKAGRLKKKSKSDGSSGSGFSKLSTGKITLIFVGGAVGLAIIGGGAFFLLEKPAAPAVVSAPYHPAVQPNQPMQQPAPRTATGNPAIVLPGTSGASAAPMERTPAVSSAAVSSAAVSSAAVSSAGNPISQKPISSLSNLPEQSNTHQTSAEPSSDLGLSVASSASAEPNLPSPSASVPDKTVAVSESAPMVPTVTAASISNAGEGKNALQKIATLQKKVSVLQGEVNHWKSLAEQNSVQKVSSPKVIYRTIVRYVPAPQQQIKAPNNSGLPSGYRIVGGDSHSLLIKTPSGAFRQIRQGDTIDGKVVDSIENGRPSFG